MTRFSDQLSAVRQAQLEAQLDMFRNLTSRALDSAGQIAALNVRASRASMEQAAGTMKHLLEARDPRDLLALGSAAQGQWHTLFSYGRELFGLAIGARALPATIPLLAAPAPTANVPTTYTQVIDQVSIATDAAATITGEIAAAAVDIGAAQAEAALEAGTVARTQAAPANQPAGAAASEPADAQLAAAEAAIDTAIADDVPPAEPTPLAKALSEVSPKPAGAEHPLASTVPLEAGDQVELPAVRPQENVARAKPSRGPRRK
ncbi:phasin family protein [Massilia sp. LXY-6]|uniref:phasin family protein n=1 Tax=Massilia sp. LXY-6 TaxID=3379823 RepID=UPI003EE27E55